MIKSSKLGTGSVDVVLIHDWFCDHTSYDACHDFLDQEAFTFHFVDLRGYGLSKKSDGPYSLYQAYQDILAYIKDYCSEKVHLVGHSMSTLIVQKFLEKDTSLLKSAIVIGPVPAFRMQAPNEVIDFMRSICTGNDEGAYQAIGMMTSDRLNASWAKFKVKRWREVSIEQARLDYLDMFVSADFAESLQEKGDQTLPLLVITGKYDTESSRTDAMKHSLLKWFPTAQHVEVENAGHYPMQETPPFFASTLDHFHKEVG